MNERIHKLAEQAGFNLIRENCYDIVSAMSVQEFALLIARECANCALQHHLYGAPETSADAMIKQHFGID